MSTSASTVMALLEQGAPDATALSAPGGVPLSYQSLLKLASATLAALNARGIGPESRPRIFARQQAVFTPLAFLPRDLGDYFASSLGSLATTFPFSHTLDAGGNPT